MIPGNPIFRDTIIRHGPVEIRGFFETQSYFLPDAAFGIRDCIMDATHWFIIIIVVNNMTRIRVEIIKLQDYFLFRQENVKL